MGGVWERMGTLGTIGYGNMYQVREHWEPYIGYIGNHMGKAGNTGNYKVGYRVYGVTPT